MKLANTILNPEASKSLQAVAKLKFPMSISWKISKFIREYDENTRIFSESVNKLIKRFGKKDKKTGNYQVDPKDVKNFEKFLVERHDLSIIKVAYKAEKIKLNLQLLEKKDIEIPAMDLFNLEFLFEIKEK